MRGRRAQASSEHPKHWYAEYVQVSALALLTEFLDDSKVAREEVSRVFGLDIEGALSRRGGWRK